MLECLTEGTMPALYAWSGSGNIPARAGMRHNMIVPYGAYSCADDAVNLAIQNQREWRRFCGVVLNMPTLTDDLRFATNADRLRNRIELEALIEVHFRKTTKAEILALLDDADIANGTVNDMSAVREHAQHTARKRWVSAASPTGMISAFVPPHNLMRAPARIGP